MNIDMSELEVENYLHNECVKKVRWEANGFIYTIQRIKTVE